jgi:hypothetical protein
VRPRLSALVVWLATLGLVIGFVVVAAIGGTSLGDAASALVGVTFSSVGVLIATRRRDNLVGWVFLGIGASLALNGFSFTYADYLNERGGSESWHWFAWTGTWSWQPGLFLLVPTLFLVFPDGHTTWRTGRKLLSVCLVGLALSLIGTIWNPADLPGAAGYRNPVGLEGWLDPLDYALLIGSALWFIPGLYASGRGLYLRFRSAHGAERQQLKWFVWAGFGTLATYITGSGLYNGFSSVPGGIVALLGVPLLPVATGVAILRYRLFDIDVVINRTLVYTVILAGVYVGMVFAFQAILAPVTSESDLAVAASTLAVAALFRPARTRVQSFIDHRFYRRKFDAQRTLDEFSSSLRDELDLNQLSAALTRVVSETMQPAHASLWLRTRGSGGAA